MTATIYYDGDCPFCTSYVGLIRLRDAVGPVDLVNLRESPALREELSGAGFDLDLGMVVDLDGKRVGGADATHLLATLSTDSDFFNRLNRAVFAKPLLSATIYPVLRSGRWLTLFLLGRSTINDNDEVALSRQKLFALLFSFFSLFHVLNYAFEYHRWPIGLDLVAVFACALALLLHPGSARLLFLLILVSTISTIVQAPANSNHTMLRSMFLIGYWLSFLYAMARARPIPDIFANTVLSGRGALLVMYFYGIFHKINADFLNPEYSCAAALWDHMLPPMRWVQSVYLDYVGIYATFLIEGALVIALLIPKTRHLGMVGGICFHVFLSFSSFAAYISFTTLTISMHVLFLSKEQLDRINASHDMAWLKSQAQLWTNKLAFLILFSVGAFFMLLGRYNVASLCLLPAVFAVCALIMRYGRAIPDDVTRQHSNAAYVIGTIVTCLYFVNGALPYAGLKTAQTVNMFSNLRLEGGVSNHLLFRNPPHLFNYLDDVAVVKGFADGDDTIIIEEPRFATVYYDLLASMADNPARRFSFTLNGQLFENVSAADFQTDIEERLHHPFIRKYFHFIGVSREQPQTCF